MVDRAARDEMAATLERYLTEEITAFEFDAAMDDIFGKTEDQTVREVRCALWSCYSDITDHRVVASKDDWDYFQRLLLLLRSDAEMEVVREKKWTARQWVALSSLMLYVIAVIMWGEGAAWALCIPVSAIVVALLCWRRLAEPRRDELWDSLAPFTSIAEIFTVRKSIPLFSKRRYPEALQTRRMSRIDSWLGVLTAPIAVVMAVFFLSPIVLLILSFPEKNSEHRIVVP